MSRLTTTLALRWPRISLIAFIVFVLTLCCYWRDTPSYSTGRKGRPSYCHVRFNRTEVGCPSWLVWTSIEIDGDNVDFPARLMRENPGSPALGLSVDRQRWWLSVLVCCVIAAALEHAIRRGWGLPSHAARGLRLRAVVMVALACAVGVANPIGPRWLRVVLGLVGMPVILTGFTWPERSYRLAGMAALAMILGYWASYRMADHLILPHGLHDVSWSNDAVGAVVTFMASFLPAVILIALRKAFARPSRAAEPTA